MRERKIHLESLKHSGKNGYPSSWVSTACGAFSDVMISRSAFAFHAKSENERLCVRCVRVLHGGSHV